MNGCVCNVLAGWTSQSDIRGRVQTNTSHTPHAGVTQAEKAQHKLERNVFFYKSRLPDRY